MKTRVALLLPSHWSALQGGAEYQVRLLCRHLVESDRFEVHWVSRRVHPDYRAEGYRVHDLGAPAGGLRAQAFVFDHARVDRTLRAIRPQVIYQRVGCAYTGMAARHAARHGARLVWHVASDQDLAPMSLPLTRPKRWLKYLDKLYLEHGVRHATDIVVQTAHQQTLLEKRYGRRARALIRNFHPPPAEVIDKSGPLRVLWIANLKPLKQPEVFLRLARACVDLAPARFVMIGQGMMDTAGQRAFEHAARALPNLDYLGELPVERVNELLARAHVLVNTSTVEGFANTFIQAWMRRVPVLSLHVDPDGLLAAQGIGHCAHGDEGGLVTTLRAWLADARRREDIGRRAETYAHAHHALANVARLAALLEGRSEPV